DLLHLEPPRAGHPQGRRPGKEPPRTMSAAVSSASVSPAETTRAPQLALPFAAPAETPTAEPERDAWRLELPGLVALPDGRQITAEIVFLPPGTDVLRS